MVNGQTPGGIHPDFSTFQEGKAVAPPETLKQTDEQIAEFIKTFQMDCPLWSVPSGMRLSEYDTQHPISSSNPVDDKKFRIIAEQREIHGRLVELLNSEFCLTDEDLTRYLAGFGNGFQAEIDAKETRHKLQQTVTQCVYDVLTPDLSRRKDQYLEFDSELELKKKFIERIPKSMKDDAVQESLKQGFFHELARDLADDHEFIKRYGRDDIEMYSPTFEEFKRSILYERTLLVKTVDSIARRSIFRSPDFDWADTILNSRTAVDWLPKLKEASGVTEKEFFNVAMHLVQAKIMHSSSVKPELLDVLINLSAKEDESARERLLSAAQEADNRETSLRLSNALGEGDITTLVELMETASHEMGEMEFRTGLAKGITTRILNSWEHRPYSPEELEFIEAHGATEAMQHAQRIVETGTSNPTFYAELENKGYNPESIDKIVEYFDKIGEDEDEFEFADNYRYARSNNADEVAAYWRQQEQGCCGSCDEELETPDGVILVGFNYGH